MKTTIEITYFYSPEPAEAYELRRWGNTYVSSFRYDGETTELGGQRYKEIRLITNEEPKYGDLVAGLVHALYSDNEVQAIVMNHFSAPTDAQNLHEMAELQAWRARAKEMAKGASKS